MSTVAFYLIQLDNGRYYVGSSQDPMKSLQMHREGLGPAWTQLNHPLQFVDLQPNMDPAGLDAYVIKAMELYGVDNVRGGSWPNVRLTDQDRMSIREIGSQERGCVIA